jgi:hypothetical protein
MFAQLLDFIRTQWMSLLKRQAFVRNPCSTVDSRSHQPLR